MSETLVITPYVSHMRQETEHKTPTQKPRPRSIIHRRIKKRIALRRGEITTYIPAWLRLYRYITVYDVPPESPKRRNMYRLLSKLGVDTDFLTRSVIAVKDDATLDEVCRILGEADAEYVVFDVRGPERVRLRKDSVERGRLISRGKKTEQEGEGDGG
jgi:hypothetical protein